MRKRRKEDRMNTTLGYHYMFATTEADYDGTFVPTRIAVLALGYTQALENLHNCGYSNKQLQFLGEKKCC